MATTTERFQAQDVLVITKDIEHMDIHMVMGMGMGTEEELTTESIKAEKYSLTPDIGLTLELITVLL